MLEILWANHLFVKQSKFSFGSFSVAYLGHVILAEGVAMDSSKVDAISSWPAPQSPRGLHGFLRMAGYYHKFIKDFGTIAAPLTALLKEGFHWGPPPATTFHTLKQALSIAPTLQIPDLEWPLIVN